MYSSFRKKAALLLFTSVIIGLFLILLHNIKRQYCFGIPVVSEGRFSDYSETEELDISEIKFNNEPVAVDFPGKTIFIPVTPDDLVDAKPHTLKGILEPINPAYSLCFLETDTMGDIRNTVQNNLPLTLIIQCADYFQRVNVVLTSLPIVYFDVEQNSTDENGNSIVLGDFTLWNNYSASEGMQKTVTSAAEWHIRGNSTRAYDKKSWKLNLRDHAGENKDLDLLGLGADDDWILNPMIMDDTKVKEKLSQVLWNDLAGTVSHNEKMSEGHYIELIINGAYQGVYLLQRRIDAKFLNLNREEDILLKGRNTWEASSIKEGYEIIHSPFSEEITYDILKQTLSYQGNNVMNTDNFVDISLFLQLLSGSDNYCSKNTFYVLYKNENGYELCLLPWDTDLTLGVVWGYSFEESLYQTIERQELETVKEKVPDIQERMAVRWKELSNGVFTEENINLVLDNIKNTLNASGALIRDQEKWGFFHDGKDNWDNLSQFIHERLLILNDYYHENEKRF